MTCRDIRKLADSFVDEALGPEATGGILRHLATCSSCRKDIDDRHAVRRSLQTAFTRAPDLQAPRDFATRLRAGLMVAAGPSDTQRAGQRRWLAVAAGVALAVGLSGWAFLRVSTAPLDAMALDAIGDHWNCGLKNRAIRTPVPLEDAAQRFDRAYRLLLTAPPDNVTTPGGLVRVLDRHSCAFGTRRFGHVILEYSGRVVSLLVTGGDDTLADRSVRPDAASHVDGRSASGFGVVSVQGAGHVILLVGDLETPDLVRLSEAIAKPLAQRLAERDLVTVRLPEAYADRKECDGT
jgi:putative zinc finger protein